MPLFSKEHQKSLLITCVFLFLYLSGLACALINHPLWHDEGHFIKTILLFKSQPTLSTLTHYEEMSTPLPFILYSLWGSLFGFSVFMLRLFSLLVSLCTFLVFHYLFFAVFRRPLIATLLVVFLALNPYMAGLSIFVYTDMLMMLFTGLFLISILGKKKTLLLIAAAGGLLCRQYFVFFLIAGALYFLSDFIFNKNRMSLFSFALLGLSAVPLAALILQWKGMCPNYEVRTLCMPDCFRFHVNSVVLYVILMVVYLFPIVFLFWKNLYKSRTILIVSLSIGWLYWLWPVEPSPIAYHINSNRVGYFHRLLQLLPGAGPKHWVFFLLFVIALPLFLMVPKNLWTHIKNKQAGFLMFLEMAIISFFAVMPFSYIHWEKYFLPLLPVCALYFVLTGNGKIPLHLGTRRTNTALQ